MMTSLKIDVNKCDVKRIINKIDKNGMRGSYTGGGGAGGGGGGGGEGEVEVGGEG